MLQIECGFSRRRMISSPQRLFPPPAVGLLALPTLSTVLSFKYLKTRPHGIADNYPAPAHTWVMSAQLGRPSQPIFATRNRPLEILARRTFIPLGPTPSIRLNGPISTLKSKKAALGLVQSALNSFIINIILRNSRRKNAEKRAKSTQIQPFSGVFQAFSALFWHHVPSPHHRPAKGTV